MKKAEKTVNDYIAILETQYNLLFDYMWSMGTFKYLRFLKESGYQDYREHHRYTRRITSSYEWNRREQ